MILIRHPVTAAPAGLCYGRTDPGLGTEAAEQVSIAVNELAPREAVVSSPAPRCLILAEALVAGAGTVRIDTRLTEMDFGIWEGRFWDDISRTQSDPWADDPWSTAPPGGETFAAVHARVAAALDDTHASEIIVTHAGVIRAARMIVEGASFATVFSEPVPYAKPIHLERRAA